MGMIFFWYDESSSALRCGGVSMVNLGDYRELVYLDGGQDGVCLAHYAYDDGALLDGFLCVLDLEDSALRRAVAVSYSLIIAAVTTYKVTESLS
jgi:hypothetical protein